MPGKMARLDPRPEFRLSQVPVVVPTSRPSCGKPGKKCEYSRQFGSHSGEMHLRMSADAQPKPNGASTLCFGQRILVFQYIRSRLSYRRGWVDEAERSAGDAI
jgi:hypothetical protein